MGTVDKIIDFADQIAKEEALTMRKYIEWQEYIEPLVQSKFKLKGRFDINLRNMAKQEIQDYIKTVEEEFEKLYEVSLNPLNESPIGTEIWLHGDILEDRAINLYIDDNNIFHAVYEDTGEIRYFEMVKPFEVIEKEHKTEILDYCLGKGWRNEELYSKDVFMHGNYCKEITLFNTDFVLLHNGTPKEKLDIIYAKESVAELYDTGFELANGEGFVAMTNLSKSLQKQYLKSIVSLKG